MMLFLFSGVAAGITALFHLNGVTFVATGALVLLLNKKIKYLMLFMFGCFLGFIAYFFEILNTENFQTFLHQFNNDPALGGEEYGIISLVQRIILEPKRYLHHTYEATYFIIFVFIVYANWSSIKNNKRIYDALKYFIILSFFVAVITPGGKTVYLLYTLPYILLIISYYFIETIFQPGKKIALYAFVTLFIITNIGHGYIIFERRNSDMMSTHAGIMKKYNITKNDRILAPRTFIFNEMGNVEIFSLLGYRMRKHYQHNREDSGLLLSSESLFKEAYAENIKLIILDDRFMNMISLHPTLDKIYFGYKYSGKERHLHVFKYN